jgi:uncharacterized protein YkwD
MKTLLALILSVFFFLNQAKNLLNPLVFVPTPTQFQSASPTQSALQTPTFKPKPTSIPKPKPTAVGDTGPWGVSQQVGTDTFTIKLAPDAHMGTPSEILQALNNYRVRFGSQPLTLDTNLANFAQSRADYVASIRKTDGHTGFNDFLNNQDGFNKLGFTWLGENISYGFHLEAVHLIEWMYASDAPHNDNQLNNRWNYVGIGVNGTATSIIFGTGKR